MRPAAEFNIFYYYLFIFQLLLHSYRSILLPVTNLHKLQHKLTGWRIQQLLNYCWPTAAHYMSLNHHVRIWLPGGITFHSSFICILMMRRSQQGQTCPVVLTVFISVFELVSWRCYHHLPADKNLTHFFIMELFVWAGLVFSNDLLAQRETEVLSPWIFSKNTVHGSFGD